MRLIWACFKTEPKLGSDWILGGVIRAQFWPGLVQLGLGGLGAVAPRQGVHAAGEENWSDARDRRNDPMISKRRKLTCKRIFFSNGFWWGSAMPDTQNASSGFALRTYRDPDARLELVNWAMKWNERAPGHSLAQREPDEAPERLRAKARRGRNRKSLESLWWSREDENSILNVNAELDSDDLYPEGDVTKQFWLNSYEGIERWRNEANIV